MPSALTAPVKGLIFNIQRFSIQDGPGIRTTVFLKGCPLECPWCSNPESIHPYPEIMVREARCIRCGACAAECPLGASQMVDGRRIIHFELCNNCMRCVPVCTSRTIECAGEEKSTEEILDIVLRDAPYYRSTGGGLTLSGGEPLAQPRFARELAKAAHDQGVHVALDTCGSASWENLAAVLESIDLVLYDIKSLDEEKHMRYTGVSNRGILKNLHSILRKTGATVWIRIPVIPDFNLSGEETTAIGALLQALPRPVEKISLLPFHQYGAIKYQALGRPYPWADKKPESEDRVKGIKYSLEAFGLRVEIGR